jgi:hypothetical protein
MSASDSLPIRQRLCANSCTHTQYLLQIFLRPLDDQGVEEDFDLQVTECKDEVKKIIACSRELVQLLKPRIAEWSPHQVCVDVLLIPT